MSLHRRNPRRDVSEPEVVAALEACGWTVQPISAKDFFDLIASKRDVNVLVECKTGRRKLSAGQQRTYDTWPGPKVVLRSADEVIAWTTQQR